MATKPDDITDDELEDLVKGESRLVVDFWAPWCQPCKVITPIVEELAEQYQDGVAFVQVNIDDNARSPAKYSIMGVPTLLFFKDGQLIDRVVGVAPRARIEEVLKKIL
ncbi:MAG: thioredoxin [Candidatus Thermoplasmatota archaeon]|nr:thioredoxin [Candidatus Thermoplasmatota archaeon]